jgi:Xaa-Pro aminopeptidase
MDGGAFRSHRQRTLDVFKSSGITQGLILYTGASQPKEAFTGMDLVFLQEALFFWLTGWEEPDSALVIDITTGETTLLVPEYDAHYEIWNGPAPTTESIIAQTGVDAVAPMKEFDNVLVDADPIMIFTAPLGVDTKGYPTDTETLMTATAIARTLKAPHEIEALRTAARLTGEAIIAVLREFRWRPGKLEVEVEAAFAHHGVLLGCRHQSFPTIVGSGPRCCYLHYARNECEIPRDDLVLLDCGLLWHHYAGDITRTFPASGKFTADQATVYGLLLAKQKLLIAGVKPGVTRWALGEQMRVHVFDILTQIGVVPPDAEYTRAPAAFFVPHRLSHHIGVNTHDYCIHREVSKIQDFRVRTRMLVPGMVISVEPGIYFHPTRLAGIGREPPYDIVNLEVAGRFARSVGGIRIEDDVLVTETGCEVLSANCPKEMEEIEALLAPA